MSVFHLFWQLSFHLMLPLLFKLTDCSHILELILAFTNCFLNPNSNITSTSFYLMLWISSNFQFSPQAGSMVLHFSLLGLTSLVLYQELPICSCWQAITDNYHWQLDFEETAFVLCTLKLIFSSYFSILPKIYFLISKNQTSNQKNTTTTDQTHKKCNTSKMKKTNPKCNKLLNILRSPIVLTNTTSSFLWNPTCLYPPCAIF